MQWQKTQSFIQKANFHQGLSGEGMKLSSVQDTKVKNTWRCTFFTHYICMSSCLIKAREFTFPAYYTVKEVFPSLLKMHGPLRPFPSTCSCLVLV